MKLCVTWQHIVRHVKTENKKKKNIGLQTHGTDSH